jgi:protocatechuate 3,4-dioxygenase beta subunit
MKRLLYITMALVAVGLAQDLGAISGQVVDAATGDPIASAVVICHGDSGQAGRAQTNERGLYRIPNLAAGRYRLSAQARGYEPAHYPEPVVVRPGQVTQNINFRLRPMQRPTGAISGRVTDRRTGEPVRGALVVAAGREWSGRARTDERGNYVIRGLRPGAYRVKAAARGYKKESFPRPVPVEAGQVTEDINFALQPKPVRGAISGRVVDAKTQEPVAGAVVVAVGEHGRNHTRTDRRGCYRMALVPGEYQVTAQARGYEPQVFPRRVPVRAHEVTRDVNFSLRRMHTDSD